MKKFIPTLLALAVFIGLFWYASGHSFFKKEDETIRKTAQLFSIKKEDVQGIYVKTDEGETELSLKDGSWTMQKPQDQPINHNLVGSWLDTYVSLSREEIVEDQASDLAKFGLDKPSAEYRVTLKNGESKLLQTGINLPTGGAVYAKLADSNQVFPVAEQSLMQLNKTPIDFVDRNPAKFDYDKVTRLDFSWNNQSWTLAKEEADKSLPESKWKVNQEELPGTMVSSKLDKLLFLTTEQLVEPASNHPEIKGELRIEVTEVKDGQETKSVYLGQTSGDLVWITKEGGPWAYAIPAREVQDLASQGKLTEEEKKQIEQEKAEASPSPSPSPSDTPAP